MIADVPVAFCLSGGVDSRVFASIAAKHYGRQIHTFSIIDQDVHYSETENIKAIMTVSCREVIIGTTTAPYRCFDSRMATWQRTTRPWGRNTRYFIH